MAPKPPGRDPRFLRVLDQFGRPVPRRMLTADYEAASFGRRLASTWGTSTAGPNMSLAWTLGTLRARSRQLVRNKDISSGAVDTWVSNLIGTGITPRWQIEDKALKKDLQDLWSDWIQESDADGMLDFHGQQALAARAMVECGEALARLRIRRMEDGLAVPLQVQLLEPDHLDETYSGTAENGNPIRMGIEFNRIGRRVAYHLFRDHPGDGLGSTERTRVPASEICHVYRPLRAGQLRGVPWMAPVILTLHELDQYEDAELVRKKTAAMFGGFITQPYDEDDLSPLGLSSGADAQGRDLVALEPGTFPVLDPGMDIRFAEPADVGGQYEAWMTQQLRRIARGVGITYEQLSGDLRGVTYSSVRAALLEFRRFCKQIQLQVLAFQFCRRVAVMWMDLAVLSGVLPIRDYWYNRRKYLRITWRPDGWDWVDPWKDQKAEQLSVRCGFKSRAQVIAERGGDVDVVDRELADDNARADDLGLVLDSDPRKTSTSGAMQDAEDALLWKED